MRFDLGLDLTALRAAALLRIDGEAEACRMRHITPGAGQAVTYDLKRREAEAMAADPTPDPAAYPMLAVEVGITATTLAEVGAVVRYMSGIWIATASQIEGLRLGAKDAVRAATNAAAVRVAAGVDWPLPPAGRSGSP